MPRKSRSFMKATEPVVEETPQVVEQVAEEDRSAFNCPECKGEGINVVSNVICGTCAGKGKV